jgi:hypothetical protein
MKPLEGLTILDLSRVLACPFATMILAELGARVIKVEQPGSGDETRSFEPQLARDSAYYFVCNRTKESITVNLRADEGRKLIRELAGKADVLVENFPVGTLGKYGLDFAALSAINPRLIYVSCTGFGQSGPYKDKKGYDTVFQAMGGIMSLTGERGGGPVKPGLPSPISPPACGWRSPCSPRWRDAIARAAAATSTFRCSMARSRSSRWRRPATSRSAKRRRALAPSIRGACPRRAFAARTASMRTSRRATSIGRRSASHSISRNGAGHFQTTQRAWSAVPR